ncbi:hypothetical protein [uncultured Flavobacterium sp.]|nr:hypothetical protein [uncultured Flavobacterium sp.]
MTKEDYPENHPHYILFYGEKNTENDWYTLNEKEEKYGISKK